MLPMDGFVVRCIFGRAGCELAPLLTSPAGGGGTAPSPRAGRAGADKGTSLEFTVCGARTLFRPHPQPLSHCVGEGCRGARRCALQRVPPLPPAGEGDKGGEGNTAHLLVHACAGKNSPCFKDFVPNRCTLTRRAGADKGTSLEFTVCEARTLFRPHPQPLSHSVGEGCRGARRCVPPLPQAGEGDKGGEGNTAHLPVHACAGKNSPCFKDFVPNRCTLTRKGWGGG
jgi:hypothetical protein